MASNDSGGKEYLWRSAGEEASSGQSSAAESGGATTEQHPTITGSVRELAQWWWGWWFDRHGYSGIVLPAALAVFYWLLLGWPAILLGAGLGIFARLLWSRDTTGSKIGAAAIAALPLLPFVLFAVVWLLPVLLLAAGIAWLIRRGKPQPTGHYHARWAEASETEDMQMSLKGNEKEGVLLAHHDGEPIGVYPGFENKREMGHILVAGPTRSGKGLHLITNLLRCQGSVVVNDIKGELYDTTASWREQRLGSKIEVLDPSGRGSRYDPFAELSYRPEALMGAAELIMAPQEERQPIFARRAMNGLYAAALAARKEDAPTLPYVRDLTREGPREFAKKLNGLGDEDVRTALIEFIGDRPENLPDDHYTSDAFFTSSWETMITKLRPFFSDGVLRMCGGSDFEAADLVREPTTLYLRFAEGELRYTREVYQVVLQALITGLIRHGDVRGNEVPLLLALDEAGRTPIPELDDLVSTISGRGMSAMIYVQGLKQLDSAYDEDRAEIIRGNCHTQLLYRPQEPDTAAYISRMSGQTSAEDVSYSKSIDPRPLNLPNESRGMRERELITEDEARQVSEETVFIFTGRKRPILAQRLKWFELMPEVAQFAEDHPPAEPEELPMPERRWGDVDGHGGLDDQKEPKEEPSAEDAGDESASGGGRRRRRGSSGQGREGGYIEPDV